MPYDFNIFHYGDVHDGSILSSKHGWAVFVDALNSEYDGCKNNYAIEGGDPVEAITVDDPRFSPETLDEPLPLEQLKYAVQKREPIKERLLVELQGNHDRKLWRFGNIAKEIADQLGCQYGTYTCKISFTDKKDRLMFKLYETHGSKSITSSADDKTRRISNMKLSLKRNLKFKAGDCAVMVKHHAHKLIVCEPEPELYLTDNGKQIKQNYTSFGQNESYIPPDMRWYGCAGAFLTLFGQGISGYAEVAEYDPVELGWLVTSVRNKKIVSVKPYYLKI